MKNLHFFFLFFASALSAQSRFQDPSTGKWGYWDREWNIIVPAIYDEVQPNFDTIMAVKKDGKMGALDEKGRYRIPLIYEHIVPNFNGFRSQYGYAAVTKNSKTPDTWGMVDARGKIILPEKFYYVRALTPQLLAGRVSTDTFIQFYDLKGRLLYKIKGRNIEPFDMDNTCYGVNGLDRKVRAYKLDGTPVFPSQPEAGIWTDGNLTIFSKGPRQKGMINSKGDTIIPFEYQRIRHGLPGQFIVEKANGDFMVSAVGVYNKNGNIVIPFANQGIVASGKVYQVYDHAANDLAGVFSADGHEILPLKFRFSSVYISERNQGEKISGCHPERYISATDPDTRQQFLIRNDGTIIRPAGSQAVRYYSEYHPLIIEMAPEAGTSVPRQMAIDLNGKVLLPAEYLMLDFTPDPKVLMGSKTLVKQGGFIPLEVPGKAELTYDYRQRFSNGYYRMHTGHKYDLYNLQLKRIHSGEYNWFNEPNRDQYEQFRFAKKTKEKLVAVAFHRDMTYGEWLGITESGQSFLFKEPEKKPEVKIQEAKVAETVVMEEMPAIEIEAPPPPAADHVFQEFDVQQAPEFPGGKDSLAQYLIRNLKYPRLAAENAIQGMVVVRFIIEKDGAITNVNIIRDIGGGCGKEAQRLVEGMPKWLPGKKNGKPVRVEYTLPVRFRLE